MHEHQRRDQNTTTTTGTAPAARSTVRRSAAGTASDAPDADELLRRAPSEQSWTGDAPMPTRIQRKVDGAASGGGDPDPNAKDDGGAASGMPAQLRTGVESLSGMSLGDVRVHYNSAKPAQLQALSYAQGNEIHLGPGQERHLPHEAWHVVQQRQGRVKASMIMTGPAINNDASLEKEADEMGAKAVQGG